MEYEKTEMFLQDNVELMKIKSHIDKICRMNDCNSCPLNNSSKDNGRCFKDDFKDLMVGYVSDFLK